MVLAELKRIIKEGLVILGVLAVILFLLITANKDVYLAPTYEVFLLLYASFMGWAIFDKERVEGAMEFMLQLPIPRLKLFLLKLIPRIVAVIFILIIYHFIQYFFDFPFLLSSFKFSVFYFSVFLVSLAFSLSIKSFISTFFLTVFISTGIYYFIFTLDWTRPDSVIIIQSFLTILIFPLLFLFIFRRFDIKPVSYFNIKFFPVLVLLLISILAITYFATGTHWWYCYLTKDGNVLRVALKKTVLIKNNEDMVVFNKCLIPLLESQHETYALDYRRGKGKGQSLVRVDFQKEKVKKLYQPDEGWWFHRSPLGRNGVKFGRRAYFLLTDQDHKNYRIIEIIGDEYREIPIKMDFGREGIHYICQVTGPPLQFIVYTNSMVYRIFANGEAESAFAAEEFTVWKNRILIFTEQGMTLYEMGQDIKLLFKDSGKIKRIRRRFEDKISKKVFIRQGNSCYIFNMENMSRENVNLSEMPYYYLDSKRGMRIVWVEDDKITVSEFVDRHFVVEKVWYPKLEGFKIIMVHSSGVVVYNKKEYDVYRFENNHDF